ncbi:hypothetical protein K461DRAFT_218701 [Myriangium duriaei CBS 260.36]|uniref:T6SS Phospholipase effector Tle1-like catalytic domain-containing protein n=1 Tax=Myriangium duriaei CBS 260.36 TaxID=1168546 RepID=A0A9P4J836_9PEZI|nr:hypothetical protein K461DRAFT_218701 [Myriangium duriaei CBS 260.36]
MGDSALKRRGSYPIQNHEFTEANSSKPNPWDDKSNSLPSTIRAFKEPTKAEHTGRSLIVMLDGTGDQFDHDNSNVVHFISCLKKHENERQVVYYQSGIGTSDEGGILNYVKSTLDMAIGSSLGTHIKDAYKFLMRNYREGDRICLLGFSRGAYTVRCLVGMLHKIGLLPANNFSQVGFAYNFYKDNSHDGWKMSHEFKRTFCTDVSVYFVGLWDCVASVGIIPRKLPFSKSPTNSISYFRHAMSLDEHRSKFKICQWRQDEGLEERTKKVWGQNYKFNKPPTDVLEVWFMGAHADVGGGAVANETRNMLSRIPLRWMIRQCFECNTGILFNTKRLAEHGLDVHTLWPTYRPSSRLTLEPPPSLLEAYESKTMPARELPEHDHHLSLMSEATEDYFDARAPVNDQLVQAKGWWLLEFWPVKVHMLKANGETWEKRVRWNLGRHRACRQNQPKIHWTVQHMMDEKRYNIRARVDNVCTWHIAD